MQSRLRSAHLPGLTAVVDGEVEGVGDVVLVGEFHFMTTLNDFPPLILGEETVILTTPFSSFGWIIRRAWPRKVVGVSERKERRS